MAAPQAFVDANNVVRAKDCELVIPIIVGTIAFNMGKKATDSSSHKWTVYVRGVDNEDLSYLVAKVQFDLHQTFAVPTRYVEVQPFEVHEQGWGEFDIGVHIHFTVDVGENPVVIHHKLRLYDDGEQVGCKQDPKKPVVFESFEQLVFSEPRLELYTRLKQHIPVPLTPPPPLLAWWKPPREDVEIEHLRALRARIAHQVNELRLEINPGMQGMPMPGMQPPPSHSAPGHMGGMPGFRV